MPVQGSRSVRRRNAVYGAIVVLLGIYTAVLYGIGLDPRAAQFWSDGFWTLAAAAVAWRSYTTAQGQTTPPDKEAWVLFATASLSWTAGMLVWDYFELVAGIATPFPSISDLGFYGFAVFFVAGSLRYGSRPESFRITLKHGLNIGIVFVAIALIAALSLYDALHRTGESVGYVAVAVGYPIVYGTAFLFAVSWFWTSLSARRRRAYGFLVAGFAMHTAVNIVYAATLLVGGYQTGLPLDVFWLVGFGLLYVGALEADRATGAAPSVDEEPDRAEGLARPSEALVPGLSLMAVLLAGFLYRDIHIDPDLAFVLFALAGAFTCLTVAREVLIFGQQRRVYQSLLDAQAQIVHSERDLRSILDTMADTYYRTDAEGRLIMVSKSVTALLGYAPWEAVGRLLSDFYAHPEKRTDFLSRLQAAGGVALNQEMDMRHRDGRVVWVSVNANYVTDPDGAVVGVQGTARDITERKKADLALRDAKDELERRVEERTRLLMQAKEEAEAASRAKSEFLSSMSHELRTPLNAVLGFAQFLEYDKQEPLSERQRTHVDMILRGGNHLMELISQVLELSRIESGTLFLAPEPTSVRDVVDESLLMIQDRAEREGVAIVDRIDETAVPMLRTDKTRLTQVLVNLLSNAVKYNRKHGSVTLACAMTPDRRVRISVSDTGSGIPADKHHALFQPFDRLGRESGPIEGAGIGLAITKHIVDLLDARLDFESEVGVGSTFWVDVPVSGEA